MSLPPLLLERLKKRGIICELDEQSERDKTRKVSKKARKTDQTSGTLSCTNQEQEEEIIAEDYSEEAENDDISENSVKKEKIKSPTHSQPLEATSSPLTTEENNQQIIVDGPVLGCPNKYNIYHQCSKYCIERFGQPDSFNPNLDQKKYLLVLLREYPLPSDWSIVYDAGLKTFYFWDTLSNYVSWLPPTAGAQISVPADILRSSLMKADGLLS